MPVKDEKHRWILVAEDEEVNRKAIIRSLELSGYHSSGASNGLEVQQILTRQAVDLILLDIRMPDMDGVQVMEWMRENKIHIPVIILTAYATVESAIAAVKAGAVDYLIKPQNLKDILEVVEQTLHTSENQKGTAHLVGLMEEALTILKETNSTGKFLTNQVELGRMENLPQLRLEKSELQLYVSNPVGLLKIISLTLDQAKIIEYFMAHPNQTLHCIQIATKALNYSELREDEAQEIIRPHILRIRRKIEIDPGHPKIIITVRNGGYRINQ